MSIRNRVLAGALLLAAGAFVNSAAPAHADAAPSLPVFTPYPSDWHPDYVTFPYNLWQNRVTPEMRAAGIAILRADAEDCFPYWDSYRAARVAEEVYRAMAALRPSP